MPYTPACDRVIVDASQRRMNLDEVMAELEAHARQHGLTLTEEDRERARRRFRELSTETR